MRDVKIMDIAMNLARIGNWAADDFDGKEKRINMFLDQTNAYLKTLPISSYSLTTQQALDRFTREFTMLQSKTPRTIEDKLRWAEAMLTWSNILTHRAKISDCPHCDHASFALEKPLLVTDTFYVVCDVHPLTEGHILIIPKQHISCAGAFSEGTFAGLLSLYQQVSEFVKETYGSVSSFEHGVLGQTVFHAHIHILPYDGDVGRIIPEGADHTRQLRIDKLREEYEREGKYLFFSIGNDSWAVDAALGKPRFFRDRFAQALGVPERGDWKSMHANASLVKRAAKDIASVQSKWILWK